MIYRDMKIVTKNVHKSGPDVLTNSELTKAAYVYLIKKMQ